MELNSKRLSLLSNFSMISWVESGSILKISVFESNQLEGASVDNHFLVSFTSTEKGPLSSIVSFRYP